MYSSHPVIPQTRSPALKSGWPDDITLITPKFAKTCNVCFYPGAQQNYIFFKDFQGTKNRAIFIQTYILIISLIFVFRVCHLCGKKRLQRPEGMDKSCVVQLQTIVLCSHEKKGILVHGKGKGTEQIFNTELGNSVNIPREK